MRVDGTVASDDDGGRSSGGNVDYGSAWERVRRRLRAELGEDVFSSWFGRLELVAVIDGIAHLTVPTRFLKSWIQSHYMDRVNTLMAAECEGVTGIDLAVRNAAVRAPSPSRAGSAEAQPGSGPAARPAGEKVTHLSLASSMPDRVADQHADADGLTGSPLDRRMTFATFLVGSSNQLAHAAALRLAQIDARGTAALQSSLHPCLRRPRQDAPAAGHRARGGGAGRRVIYLTAEKFMYGFVAALKAQTAIAFKERLRGIDVLVIDDVQFLQGKSIQQEFCHTLNALIDAGRQIVIAADRPPADLESLDERVRSRLAGGLCVEMGALDEELRIKILETRIAAARRDAARLRRAAAGRGLRRAAIATNGRDLDGAVNRLLAHSTLTGAALTVETAEAAIRDLVRTREPKRVKIEDIQKLVATHYNVSRADILSSRRTANVVRPRQIAMYLSKVLTLRSLPEIGRRFGGRDHTTVLHAVRKIEGVDAEGRDPAEEIELLKRMLQE